MSPIDEPTLPSPVPRRLEDKVAIVTGSASGIGRGTATSSGASEGGHIAGAAYATSKAGVNALTQHVATQFGKRGIRCNAVLPGLIMTPAVESAMTRPMVDMILEHHLTTHPGQPEDIAAMVAFLASDDARYITGQLIRVDGGIGAHLPTFADTNRAIAKAQDD